MKKWILGAVTGLLLLAIPADSGRLGAQAPTPWKIGDVFIGAGWLGELDAAGQLVTEPELDILGQPTGNMLPVYLPDGGVYRVLSPEGIVKGYPDLIEFGLGWATGCAFDPTAADDGLFTTSFDGMTMSQFPSAEPHTRADPPIDIANLPVAASAVLLGVQPFPILGNMAIESVTFDSAGSMFVGAQVLPTSANVWRGDAWILKISKGGELLNWWPVDSGNVQNPGRDPAISVDVHGVDWLDLSNDENTIFYTSEDTFIRSFNVAGPKRGVP